MGDKGNTTGLAKNKKLTISMSLLTLTVFNRLFIVFALWQESTAEADGNVFTSGGIWSLTLSI